MPKLSVSNPVRSAAEKQTACLAAVRLGFISSISVGSLTTTKPAYWTLLAFSQRTIACILPVVVCAAVVVVSQYRTICFS